MHRRALLRSLGGLALSAGGVARAADAAYEPGGRLAVPGATETVVGPDGTTAFVAVGTGFVTVDLADPTDPTVLARVTGIAADREDGPLESILDVAVDGDRLLVSGPANTGALKGLVVYDVSDPADPVPATEFYPTGFDVHNAYLADGYAYLTNNRPRWPAVVVVDVSGTAPTEVGRWSPDRYDPPATAGWNDLVGLPWPLHDVTVRGDYAYCCYWDAGTWILDVADPGDPTFVSRVGAYDVEELVELATQSGGGDLRNQFTEAPGNDHSASVDETGDLLAVGGEAWDDPGYDAGEGPAGIRLYDVSTPEDPRRLAEIAPPNVEDASRSGTWVTAHNFDLHDGRLYSAWYQGGVKLHDVGDPSSPERLAWWRRPDETAFWAARYLTDEWFVATSYDRNAGLDEALYAFPNEPGRQADPPASMPSAVTPTTTAADATTSSDATTTAGTATGTSSRRTPGFGVLAAVLGAGTGLEAVRRLRPEDS